MSRFDGKVVIVTGGNSGIGRATALAFAREGASVAIAARRTEEGENTVRAITDAGGQASFFRTDVSDEDQVAAMVRKTVQSYGRLDCAFNNAGIEGVLSRTADYAEDGWDRLMDINLKGAWLCMKYEISEMLKLGAGCIVNCSSGNGVIGGAQTPAYTASKHAMVGLTKAAALDYARQGIRVNAVCPGSVLTPMNDRLWGGDEETHRRVAEAHPIGRISTSEEIADAVLWLCSDESMFVTGHPLLLDGGWTAR